MPLTKSSVDVPGESWCGHMAGQASGASVPRRLLPQCQLLLLLAVSEELSVPGCHMFLTYLTLVNVQNKTNTVQ